MLRSVFCPAPKYFFILSLLFIITSSVKAQDEKTFLDSIKWVTAGNTARIGDVAIIYIPEGYIYAHGDDARIIIERMGNQSSGTELGLLAAENFDWFAIFEFQETGYIKDDEKNDFDADEIFEKIKENTENSNEFRKANGFSQLHLDGWTMKPNYNEKTHNLEWAFNAHADDGSKIINQNTRILGRKGVMVVTLVSDNDHFFDNRFAFNNCLSKFTYLPGEKYAEYREGDKIAEYGLTALIVGGGAAVAAKSGFFKYLWKILVVAFIAASGFFKKLYKRFFGSKEDNSGSNE